MNIDKANERVFEIIQKGEPVLIGIGKALDTIPGMTEKTILHSGPPITWERMSGPVRGGVIGALIYEGLAKTPEEALELAQSGEITFDSCHHHQSVGPMAGIVSPSMPVWIIENKAFENKAFCTLNEGLGKVLRYGAYSGDVIERLQWMENVLGPGLKEALSIHGEINIKNLIAQALQMGDECHNRNKGATSLFIREIAPSLVKTSLPAEEISKILAFMASNDHFFLNLSMPASKSVMDAAHGIEESTIITAMARNGTEFGIRISGLGEQWFTGPAQVIDGLFFPGFSVADASLDIGDSVITETSGIGGFAMAGAPAIVQFVGGSVDDAVRFTLDMYEITIGESNIYKIPALNFRGTPTGIDVRKVVETGILPTINTGIAHKDPGVGQIGAGLVKPPTECFEKALIAFAEKYL
jgi:hypothetical protein